MLLSSFKSLPDVLSTTPLIAFEPTLENYISLVSGGNSLTTYFRSSVLAAGISTIIATTLGMLRRLRARPRRLARQAPPGVLDHPHAHGPDSGRDPAPLRRVHVLAPDQLDLGPDHRLPERSTCRSRSGSCTPSSRTCRRAWRRRRWSTALTRFQTFWRVALPLTAPGIVTTAILCLVFSWNDYVFAVTFTGPESQTLPVAASAADHADRGGLGPAHGDRDGRGAADGRRRARRQALPGQGPHARRGDRRVAQDRGRARAEPGGHHRVRAPWSWRHVAALGLLRRGPRTNAASSASSTPGVPEGSLGSLFLQGVRERGEEGC